MRAAPNAAVTKSSKTLAMSSTKPLTKTGPCLLLDRPTPQDELGQVEGHVIAGVEPGRLPLGKVAAPTGRRDVGHRPHQAPQGAAVSIGATRGIFSRTSAAPRSSWFSGMSTSYSS